MARGKRPRPARPLPVLRMHVGSWLGKRRRTGYSGCSETAPLPSSRFIASHIRIRTLAGLVASIVTGLLWDHIGHSVVFLY